MKVNKIVYQSRNDFKAEFECEHCGHKFEKWGYDDNNYWNNVMPNAICPNCKKNRKNETEEQAKENTGRNYYI